MMPYQWKIFIIIAILEFDSISSVPSEEPSSSSSPQPSSSSTPLMCFQCNSIENQHCKDIQSIDHLLKQFWDDSVTSMIVSCPMNSTFCRKITTRIRDHIRVVRYCGYDRTDLDYDYDNNSEDDEEDSIKTDTIDPMFFDDIDQINQTKKFRHRCYKRRFGHISHEVCECDQDLCNRSTITSPTIWLALGMFSFLLILLDRF